MRKSWLLVGALALGGCSGEVDLGRSQPPSVAVVGADLVDFTSVPLSKMCAVFEDQRTYCWGDLGSTKAVRTPELDAVVLAGPGGQGEICAIDAAGTVACSSSVDEKRTPKLGVPPSVDVRVGFFGGCSLDEAGRIHCWHQESVPCEGTSNRDWLDMQLPSRAVQVEFKESHGCAVTEDGKLYCFGSNDNGESGQPRSSSCLGVPTEVPGIDDAVHVTLAMQHTCVLRRSGAVTCFGESAGLGNGNVPRPAEDEPPPMLDVPDLDGVVALKSSRVATCALDSAGTLKCWGVSQCGALGISENCESTLVKYPTVVQPTLDILNFGMDDGLTCALTRKGIVQCWGFSGWNGQAQGSPVPRYIDFE